MKTLVKSTALAVALGMSSQLLAEERFMVEMKTFSDDPLTASSDCTEDCEEKNWKAKVDFGYVSTTGNTETSTMNGRVEFLYEVEKWRNREELTGLNGSENNVTTAEKYYFLTKTDYKFTETRYAFLFGDYEEDRFNGFDYQSSISAGLGSRLLKKDNMLLDLEVGAGYRWSKLDPLPPADAETVGEGIVRLAGRYEWKISDTALFEQTLSTEIGDKNTITKSYSAISAAILDRLALKVSYEVKHQSDVPIGTEKTDTITAVSLSYAF